MFCRNLQAQLKPDFTMVQCLFACVSHSASLSVPNLDPDYDPAPARAPYPYPDPDPYPYPDPDPDPDPHPYPYPCPDPGLNPALSWRCLGRRKDRICSAASLIL